MKPALRALLTNIIDYAGLFPPASLPLEQTYRNYRDYLASDDRWMLGKLICPLDQNAALADLIAAAPPPAPVDLCMLGKADHGVGDASAAGMAIQLRASGHVRLGAIEMPAAPESIATRMHATQIGQSLPDAQVFFEIAWNDDWRPRWTAAIQAVKQVQARAAVVGLKLRTGGVSADAFPPAAVIAGVIELCRLHGVRIKLTAGLHHPIRRYHDSVRSKMHGFINVLAAGVMAHTHGVDAHGMVEILETEDAGEFFFDDYGMKWKTLHASTQRIKQARENALISFGSCSFDEPREDLRQLGWM